MKYFKFILTSVLVLIYTQLAYPQFSLDLESGAIFSGYNNVRIPGNQGTLFSLSEALEADPAIFFRAKLNFSISPRNTLSLLYAPLKTKSTGEINRDILFASANFPANTPLEGTYIFNSYRLSYRYEFYRSEKIEFGLGLTGKIRDAVIRLESGTIKGEKENLGFVPLINFRLRWKWNERIGLLLDGDALAAPQGRAEDVLIALQFDLSSKTALKAGYRLLEGGADNEEVYTFALLHYASLGLMIQF